MGRKKPQFNTNSIAGTRDFHPDDMRLRNWLIGKWHETSLLFGFEEYDTPILEPLELYTRKAGEEIVDQMYAFEDRSKQKLTLRPEMTPSLVRLVEQRRKKYIMPLKWYSVPQCWRYETLTRGRKREFYQWNIDIVGSPSIAADAEIIALAVFFLQSVGFTSEEILVKVSSRQLIQSALCEVGIDDALFAKVCVVIDKLDKLEEEDVFKQLAELGVARDVAEQIIEIVQTEDLDVLKTRFSSTAPAVEDLLKLYSLLEGYGIRDWVALDPTVIRGLSYYTGPVFEIFSKTSELKRAICGGGRYDKIFTSLGSRQDLPCTGFGLGDCVVLELLGELGKIPALPRSTEVVVLPFSEEFRSVSEKLAWDLRTAGVRTDIYLDSTRRMRKCFSYADRVGVRFVVLVSPDEWERGEVRVKDLFVTDEAAEKQFDVPVGELAAFLRARQ